MSLFSSYIEDLFSLIGSGNSTSGAFYSVFLIIGCILFVDMIQSTQMKKKQKRRQKEIALIKEVLLKHIERLPETRFYEDIYSEMLKVHKINQYELDEKIKFLPLLKQQFRKACEDLIAISPNNSCFFNSEEEQASLDNLNSLKEQEYKITKDIIKTLPALGNFFQNYNILYKNIYEMIGYEIVVGVNESLFGRLHRTESDYETNKQHVKDLEEFHKMLWGIYDIEIQHAWKKYCK